MPKLTIDNIEVEVPPGTNVLEAAKKIGVVIPHFCYHQALGSVGACRLCAMKFLEGPVKGIQMSCMIVAQDGMVVSTTDTEAVRMRQLVIEWLMINHPHDCPVCDEGGECLLQDFTVAGGHGIRRYLGKKRTFLNQDLGPFIKHEMNRCIECYRCVRFYQDFAGGTDLGTMGNAGRIYFGRFSDGKLESPFSGNLLDICPTGVYTDKTARFRARYWDYDMAPSVCPWCSLGCNTIPAARYRELLKTIARRNDSVNGWFVCDRGRFTNYPVNDPERPRQPMLDGRRASWDQAFEMLQKRVREIEHQHGRGCLAVVGSPRLAQEGNILLPQLASLLGAGFICYFTDASSGRDTVRTVSLLNDCNAASLSDVGKADCVAVVDCDPLEEAPMMALALRQAWRAGAKAFTVGDKLRQDLKRVVGVESVGAAALSAVPLDAYERPVVICGSGSSALEQAIAAKAKIAPLLSGPNAYGAALSAREHASVSLEEAVSSGKVKGIIAFEADLPATLTEGIPFVAVADWMPGGHTKNAHLLLPTTAWVEMDGTYINNEGRAQRFRKAMNPGLPVKGLDPAAHPPRIHRSRAPGGDPLPAWVVIARLIELFGGENVAEPFRGQWECLRDLDAEGEGVRVIQCPPR